MQYEWNKYIEGIVLFKEEQGLLWLCCLVLFIVLWKRGLLKGNALWTTILLTGCAVLFPVTAFVLLKAYTPYFDWLELQTIFPSVLAMGYLGVILFDYLKEQRIPGIKFRKVLNTMLAAASVVVLFAVATTFHGMDARGKANEKGVPAETAEVFTALEESVVGDTIVLAAPSEMLTYARLYNRSWQLLYGKDLWNPKAAGYIDSGYTTGYQYYEYLEQMEPVLEERDDFISLVENGHADCIIVPHYWSLWLEEVHGYEVVTLTDSYAGIIKKDILK